MRIVWDEFDRIGKRWSTVKVDGQLMKNVTMADDVEGVVEYVKGRKIATIRGKVEITDQR